jgi:DNA-binding NarL/FixJ family response regulator
MASVVIVDDQAGFRSHLRHLFVLGGLTVIGEAGNIPEAEMLLRTIQPDIAVVDVKLPGINGIEGTKRLKNLIPELKVFLISAYRDQAEVFKNAARDVGAEGFISKDELNIEVVKKIGG